MCATGVFFAKKQLRGASVRDGERKMATESRHVCDDGRGLRMEETL